MVTLTAAQLESIEALERLDVPIADVATINQLRQALLENFGIIDINQLFLTTPSLEKMLKVSKFVQTQLVPLGVAPIRVEYPSGKVITRFSIKGSLGLYGQEAVNEYLASIL